MAIGALSSAAGQMASNAMSGKSLMDGVGQAAAIGGITGGLMEGAGSLLKGGASEAGEAAEGALSDGENAASDVGESCGLSFVPSTPVATNHGEQAIGTLEVGGVLSKRRIIRYHGTYPGCHDAERFLHE